MRRIKGAFRAGAEPLARGLAALGVTANAVTVIGALLNGLAGVVVASGALPLGGALYLLFCSLDFLDGAVARVTGTVGPFGAFLDSVLDRAAEAFVLVGLIYWYAGRGEPGLAALSGLALTGSFLVSYARARAEGLDFDCEVGWLQRPERIVLIGAGLVLSPLHEALLGVILAVLAIVTAVTVWQRIRHVGRLAGSRAGRPGG